MKLGRIGRFDDLLASHGRGAGCEVCRPAVASILASTWNDFVLNQATIQDTNDRFLANIQRGGTYSVIPRIPGGEITPEKLIVHRRDRSPLRSLLQDHGRPAHRPARRARRSATRHLGGPRRRRLRERTRLRQGDADGEELHRLDLVSLRRAGLDGARHPARGALPRHPRAAQAQVRRLRLHPRVRRSAKQGLRRHRDRERLESVRVRERRLAAASRRSPGRRRRRGRRSSA